MKAHCSSQWPITYNLSSVQKQLYPYLHLPTVQSLESGQSCKTHLVKFIVEYVHQYNAKDNVLCKSYIDAFDLSSVDST